MSHDVDMALDRPMINEPSAALDQQHRCRFGRSILGKIECLGGTRQCIDSGAAHDSKKAWPVGMHLGMAPHDYVSSGGSNCIRNGKMFGENELCAASRRHFSVEDGGGTPDRHDRVCGL